MAKGDDAVARKKNRINRKRVRSSDASVSTRIAAIIASKRRRKSGKRRVSEGMCFSLPTPDDPFNDRRDNAGLPTKKPKKKKKTLARKPKNSNSNAGGQVSGEPNLAKSDGNPVEDSLSKFLVLCLKAIQSSWEKEGVTIEGVDGSLLSSSWGLEFLRRRSDGSNVLDNSGPCASKEQVAWVVSMASDTIARKEKQGVVVASPFLLYLVPSQEKAVQVRSVCKPLKNLGVHTVSLHPGASLDHQIRGLKSCEPEFLVSTPDRLLELVSLKAVDISSTSLLVLDGLKNMLEFDFVSKVKHIREHMSGDPQTIVFSDCYGERSTSVESRCLYISQNLHFYTSEEKRAIWMPNLANDKRGCSSAIKCS